MTTTHVALAEFVGVWSHSDMLADIAPVLTCREADALADLLRAEGHDDAAALFISDHARSDEEGDSHYQPRCEADALHGTGTGVCDALLDEHGVCPHASRHVETVQPL